MKNINLKYLMILIFLPLLFSCEKESEGISFETNYVVISLTGGTQVLNVGEEYVEPGYTALEGETDATDKVTVSVDINKTTAGFNSVSYEATNSDGYSASTSRTVIVQSAADFTNTLDGVYKATIIRDGVPAFKDLDFLIEDNVLDCAIGGYYSNGRNYGPDYGAGGATVTINDINSNDFTVTTAEITGFGAFVDVSDLKVDLSDNSISWVGTADFGSVFEVTLTRIKK